MADRTYDNATTFEEMMAWHREDRPSCPSEVVVMARVGYGCEMCGWSVEEAADDHCDAPCGPVVVDDPTRLCPECRVSPCYCDTVVEPADGETAQYVRNLRLEGRSHAQPCDQFSPHRDDGFCVLCGWAGVAHDIGSPSDHSDRDWAESSERLDAFMAEHDRLVAENERHQRANLLRAVLDGYGTTDEFIKEAVNTNDFDRVPWLVAEGLRAENERLRGALERIAKEPAPGSTISCRNIAKAALSGSTEGASDG